MGLGSTGKGSPREVTAAPEEGALVAEEEEKVHSDCDMGLVPRLWRGQRSAILGWGLQGATWG